MEGPRATLYRSFLNAAVPLLALVAVVSRSSAMAGLALAFASMLALAWRSARSRLLGLTVRREIYPSAFEDDAVAVDLVLENRSARAATLLEITDVFGAGMAERQALLEAGPLPRARRRRLRYRTFCSRRWGIYGVGPLSLAASDPLGLFHAERRFAQLEAFSVFPRVYDVAGLERLGARPSLTPQEATAGRPGQSALYLGVRDYRPGDDLRRIHWPATARRGALIVKEYEIDLTPYFTLFLDLERGNRAGTGTKSTLEYVVRTAASLLWSAARRGDVAQVFGEGAAPLFIPPGRGELHLAHCLHELIRVRQEGATPLLELVERHRAHLPEGSTAALLGATTGVDLAALAALLETLRARGVRALLVFIDKDSFIPIDRWALPAEDARRQKSLLISFLREHGVPGAILGAEQELPEALARADLFGDAA